MQVTRIHPKVFQIAAEYENHGLVHCFLIDAPKRALIDTGTAMVPQGSILPALAELGWQPSDLRVIVNTHLHIDHAGGNAEMQEVTGGGIHIHRADLPYADRDAHLAKYLLDELQLMGNESARPAREALMRQQLGREWGVERELVDGDVIDLGGDVRLNVIHTPGHTPGSSSYLWESEGLLFSGDAVNGRGSRPNGYPLYFSARDYGASLKRLQALPIRTLVQAHRYRWSKPNTDPVRTGADVKQTLDDALAVWQAIDAAVRDELARNPRVDFPTLYWHVIDTVYPALGNDPPSHDELNSAAVNTIAAHWRDAR
jgi:hydroxyacylglutathione hydrolase